MKALHPVPSDAESNEHATPRWLTRAVARTLPTDGDLFTLDAASGAEPDPHAHDRLTVDDDGLLSPWYGHVWCNPPWSSPANDGRMKAAWLRKVRREVSREAVESVTLLLPDDTSTDWFRDEAMWADYITFLGRLQYVGSDKNPAFGSALYVFGDVPDRTVSVLEGLGPTFAGRRFVESGRQTTLSGGDGR